MITKRTKREDIYVNDYIVKDGQLWDIIDINYVHGIGHVVTALHHASGVTMNLSARTYNILDKSSTN